MAAPEGCVLRPGQYLENGETLRSRNGLFTAIMQADGNFVIYRGELVNGQPAPEQQVKNITRHAFLWGMMQDTRGEIHNNHHFEVTGPGPSPGYNVGIMTHDGYFRVYQGCKVSDIRDHGKRVAWECWNWREADGKQLGIVLENDGRLCIHHREREVVFVTDQIDIPLDEEIQCTSLEYDLSKAVVKPNGPPRESDSIESENDLEDGPPQPDSLTISYTQTTATGWKHSAGLKIGAKAQFEVGIPKIGTKLEISTEVSYGFEWNKVVTNSATKSISVTVLVPPKRAVIARVTWQENSITIPFRAKGIGKLNSGFQVPISFDGWYDGIANSDFRVRKSRPYDKGGKNRALEALSDGPGEPFPDPSP